MFILFFGSGVCRGVDKAGGFFFLSYLLFSFLALLTSFDPKVFLLFFSFFLFLQVNARRTYPIGEYQDRNIFMRLNISPSLTFSLLSSN